MPFDATAYRPAADPLCSNDRNFVDLLLASIHAGQALSVRAFHGTTHDFEHFDLDAFAAHDGAYGKVHYFTSCWSDANANYGGQGPDLTARIDNLSESMLQSPGFYGLEDEADEDEAKEMAKAYLSGDTPQVLECRLSITRPFVTSGRTRPSMRFPQFFDFDGEMEMAEATFRKDNGVPDGVDIVEYDPDLEDLYFEDVLDIPYIRAHDSLAKAFETAAHRLGLDTVPDVPVSLLEQGFDITHREFEKAFLAEESLLYLEDESGLVSRSFFAEVLRALGFDAIILFDANLEFAAMDMMPQTVHFHILPGCEDRITIESREALLPFEQAA